MGIAVAALVLATSACGGDTTESPAAEDNVSVTSTATTAPNDTAQSDAVTIPILITFGDTTLRGELWDNPAANSLRDRLPLTLQFRDLNNEEKVSHLDDPLPMTGMPSGADPQPQDIGWYAPGGNVVLYYADVGYWDGIARLGRVLDDTRPIAEQNTDFEVTLRPAE